MEDKCPLCNCILEFSWMSMCWDCWNKKKTEGGDTSTINLINKAEVKE